MFTISTFLQFCYRNFLFSRSKASDANIGIIANFVWFVEKLYKQKVEELTGDLCSTATYIYQLMQEIRGHLLTLDLCGHSIIHIYCTRLNVEMTLG